LRPFTASVLNLNFEKFENRSEKKFRARHSATLARDASAPEPSRATRPRVKLPTMKRSKPQPDDAVEAQRRATAFGAWFMANVRREIAAGRVRETIDERGERHAIN